MSKLWEQRLAARPSDYKLKESIAITARTAGLTTMAISQYVLAASQALEQKKYLHALKLILEAEAVLKDSAGDFKDIEGMRYTINV